MKKRILIIAASLLLIAFIGYQVMMYFMTAPMYLPKDLTSKEEYKSLLIEVNQPDRPNYFEMNENISLYYETQGRGETPVLIVHGGPAMPYEKHWAGLDSLTDAYTFIYYHQRGSGKSTRPFDKFETSNFYQNAVALNSTLGIPAQVADIEHIRRKLGQEKLRIISHSFGGFLATMYAIEFPEHVQSLVLVTPAEVIKMPSDGDGLYGAVQKKLPASMQEEYDQYLEKIFDFRTLFEKSEQDLIDQTLEFFPYFNTATNTSFEGNPAYIGGWMPQALYLGMGVKHDYSEYLQEIIAPTLVIYGTEDIMEQSSVQRYLDYIPNATLTTMAGTHFMFEDNPIEFGEAVKKFWDQDK